MSDDSAGDDAFGAIGWGETGAWEDWFTSFLNGIDGESGGFFDGEGGFEFEFDACSVVVAAMGMGSAFGIEANCLCDGDFQTGLDINCRFDTCATEGSEVCGSVRLDFAFGGPDGLVDLSGCTEYEGGQYPETCFSYALDVRGDGGGGDFLDQTCAATYGGQPCGCEIENGICLTVDCSPYLPGAKVDTCQVLSMVDAGDTATWIPDFEAFQPDFQLLAEEVPWAILDLDNLDFDNFDWGVIQWRNDDGDEDDGNGKLFSTSWSDLFAENPTFLTGEGLSEGVCKLMAQAADLSEELGNEGGCECRYDETTGVLDLRCSFADPCSTGGDGGTSVVGIDLPELCGSVDLTLTYASIAEIYADVCVAFLDFPETCYSYGIPFASAPDGLVPQPPPPPIEIPVNDENGAPVDIGVDVVDRDRDDDEPKREVPSLLRGGCTARYGAAGNDCVCTIDANNCLVVDCSDYEPLAVSADCQVVDLAGSSVSRSGIVPSFRIPEADAVVSDGEGGVFVAGSNAAATASSGGGGLPATTTTTSRFAAAATAAVLSLPLLW